MPTRIVQSFLTPEQCAVIPRLYNENEGFKVQLHMPGIIPPDTGVEVLLEVFTVPRLGQSGAAVCVVFFGGGSPFIVKIDKIARINKEMGALNSVYKYFTDARAGTKACSPADGLAGVAYTHFSARTKQGLAAQDRGEFEVRILDPSTAAEDLTNILEKVYGDCFTVAHDNVTTHDVALYDLYNEYGYLRDLRSTPLLTTILGVESGEEWIRIGDDLLYNPLFALDYFFRNQSTCHFGPIHGDLHPRNIILDYQDEPHLIDFRWARPNGHLMLDFVALEVSLRFFLLPRYYSYDYGKYINRVLCKSRKEEGLEIKEPATDELVRYSKCMDAMINIIRERAQLVSGQESDHEYLASLFLYLYGVFHIRECDRYLATHAMGCIAEELRETVFGK